MGIKLQGFLGWLTNYGHLPYLKQQELLWELGRIEVGLGTLVANTKRISAAIKPSITELEEWINQNHSLRLAVTKRKVSGGSRSMERFQDTAHLLSVIQTCRFQGRSVMDFFTSALMSTTGAINRPSLILQFNT